MQRQLTHEVQDAKAEGYLALTTTHAYKGDPAEPDSPLNTSLKVWITENSPIMKRLGMSGTWYNNGSENEGLSWANNLHTAFTTGNVSAYVYWIGAGPSRGEAPLILIPKRNATTPTDAPWIQLAANFWAFSQWSRFIRPGAVRVGTTNSSLGAVLSSAYINRDGSVVVQIITNGDEGVSLGLDVPRQGGRQYVEVASWLTDNANNMTTGVATQVPEAGGHVKGEIPRRSLVTFVVKYGWKKDM